MGSIPSVTQKAQPEQSMHWTNITPIVGESTHIVNRIKSLTVPCGSRLMLTFFSSGRCFSCRVLGAGAACSRGDGRLPNWLQLLRPSRLTWIAIREVVRLPSWLQFNEKFLGVKTATDYLPHLSK